MPKNTESKKSKNADKQYVGFYYGGFLKTGAAKFFMSTSEEDLDKDYESHKNYFGEYFTCKYVVCENAGKVLTKLKEALKDKNEVNDMYSVHASAATDTLKSVSGVDRCKVKKTKPEKTDASGDEKPKKPSKKDKADDETGDEKPKKKTGGKPKKKKEEDSDKESDKDSDKEDVPEDNSESGSESDSGKKPAPKKSGKSKK